jgi:sugar lactone lactonase YvrE
MRVLLFCALLLCKRVVECALPGALSCVPQTIVNTGGGEGDNGDGGLATAAGLNSALGTLSTASNDLYVCSRDGSKVRVVVNSTGVIGTIAGVGTPGCVTGGGGSTALQMRSPFSLAAYSGYLLIADQGCNCVLWVNSSGWMQRYAGTCGSVGTSTGDGYPAWNATLNTPTRIRATAAGDLYIPERNASRVRKVTFSSGLISTFCGNGSKFSGGDGLPFSSGLVALSAPEDIAWDASGNVYIAEGQGHRVRMISSVTGLIRTFAGNGLAASLGDGGPANASSLHAPVALAAYGTAYLFIAEAAGLYVRFVDLASGVIFTLMGTGAAGPTSGGDGGAAFFTQLTLPHALSLDSSLPVPGLLVSDGSRVRRLACNLTLLSPTPSPTRSPTPSRSPSPTRSPTPSNTPSRSRTPTRSPSRTPTPLCFATPGMYCRAALLGGAPGSAPCPSGNFCPGGVAPPALCACPGLCPTGSSSDASTTAASTAWNVSTLAGNGTGPWHIDGPPGVGMLCSPSGLALYGNGTLLVGDVCPNYPAIRAVDPSGYISTLIGNGTRPSATAFTCPNSDGVGAGPRSAIVWGPRALLLDAADLGGTGSLIFADVPCNMLRIMSPSLAVRTFAGVGSNVPGVNPTLPTPLPRSIGFSFTAVSYVGLALAGSAAAGTLFVTDTGHHRVFKINMASGAVSACVGTTSGLSTPIVDSGATGIATLYMPSALAMDASLGSLFIASMYDSRVRIAGSASCSAGMLVGTPGGVAAHGSVDGVGTATKVYYPSHLWRDTRGALWLHESFQPRVRRITSPTSASPTLATIAGSGTSGYAEGVGNTAQFSSQMGQSVTDGGGRVILADGGNHRLRVLTCSACPGGYYCPASGGSNRCPPGHFCPPGSLEPTPCPAGTFSPGVGLLTNATCAASACPPGAYCPPGSPAPALCPPGTYNPTPSAGGLGACLPCSAPPGRHCPRGYGGPTASPGLPCPSGSFCPGGAVGATLCACPGLCAAGGLASEATSSAPNWEVRHYAGVGAAFTSVDGNGSTTAQFMQPRGLGVSPLSGDLWVLDYYRIRAITPNGTVWSLAGSGVFGSSDGQGAAASMSMPTALAHDSLGNALFTDTQSYRLRRVSAGGYVDTLAGSGFAWADGAGGSAGFNQPQGLALSALGVVYIGESGSHTIRRVATNGSVVTIAGIPGTTAPFWDGPRGNATYSAPQGVALSPSEAVLYIADQNNRRIRALTLATLVTATLAGNGGAAGAVDGTGTSASFHSPTSLACDGSAGMLYVLEAQLGLVRRVAAGGGVVTTLSGTRPMYGLKYLDGIGGAGAYSSPAGLHIAPSGTIYISDTSNYRIRVLTCSTCPLGSFCAPSSVGGGGALGALCPPGRFGAAPGLASRSCTGPCTGPPGTHCPAGSTSSGGVACPPGFFCPLGGPAPPIACECPGACSASGLTSDPGVTGYLGGVSMAYLWSSALVAGNGSAGSGASGGDGVQATAAAYNNPRAVAVNKGSSSSSAWGPVAVGDSGGFRVRAVGWGGISRTLTGAGTGGSNFDGWNTAARLNTISGLFAGASVYDSSALYIADAVAHKVSVVVPGAPAGNFYQSTLAGSGAAGCLGGIGAAAQLSAPTAVAAYFNASGGQGAVYVADYGNHVIRSVDAATGAVSVLAGQCSVQGSVNGVGAGARFFSPHGLGLDVAAGVLYVADRGNNLIRVVALFTTPGPTVTTLAGTGANGASADSVNALGSIIANPNHLVVDSAGALFISEPVNARLRRVGLNRQVPAYATAGAAPPSTLTIFGSTSGYAEGSGAGGAMGNGAVSPAFALTAPTTTGVGGGVDLDGTGGLLFADTLNQRVRRLTCAPCAPGMACAYTPTAGPTLGVSASPCPGGFFCPLGTGTPTAALNGCPVGYYCPLGSSAPTPCPGGTYGLGTLKASLALGCSPLGSCEAGYYCPPGTTKSPGLPCGVGNFCPRGSNASTPCPPFNSVHATLGPANGPAFDVDTAACYNHCFWGGAGQLSRC